MYLFYDILATCSQKQYNFAFSLITALEVIKSTPYIFGGNSKKSSQKMEKNGAKQGRKDTSQTL